MVLLQHTWQGTENLNDMGGTAKQNTNHDSFVSSDLDITDPGSKYRQSICQKFEEVVEDIGKLNSTTESSGSKFTEFTRTWRCGRACAVTSYCIVNTYR